MMSVAVFSYVGEWVFQHTIYFKGKSQNSSFPSCEMLKCLRETASFTTLVKTSGFRKEAWCGTWRCKECSRLERLWAWCFPWWCHEWRNAWSEQRRRLAPRSFSPAAHRMFGSCYCWKGRPACRPASNAWGTVSWWSPMPTKDTRAHLVSLHKTLPNAFNVIVYIWLFLLPNICFHCLLLPILLLANWENKIK